VWRFIAPSLCALPASRLVENTSGVLEAYPTAADVMCLLSTSWRRLRTFFLKMSVQTDDTILTQELEKVNTSSHLSGRAGPHRVVSVTILKYHNTKEGPEKIVLL
jgi:hypothetical protein